MTQTSLKQNGVTGCINGIKRWIIPTKYDKNKGQIVTFLGAYMKKIIKFLDKYIFNHRIKKTYIYAIKKRSTRNIKKKLLNNGFEYQATFENYSEITFFAEINLAYNHMRKSGNSNILKIIYSILHEYSSERLDTNDNNLDDTLLDPIPHYMRKNYLGLDKYDIDRLFINKLSEAKKFTFVRNPYIRATSMFREKIVTGKTFSKLFKNISDDMDGFILFVEFLEKGGLKKDKHFDTQFNHLFFKVDNLDYIGKLENFSNNFNTMLNRFGISVSDETKELINKRKNTTHVTESEKHYKKYYTDGIAERIYRLYAIDFSTFGYEKESFDD